jgi:hypothetical protein
MLLVYSILCNKSNYLTFNLTAICIITTLKQIDIGVYITDLMVYKIKQIYLVSFVTCVNSMIIQDSYMCN